MRPPPLWKRFRHPWLAVLRWCVLFFRGRLNIKQESTVWTAWYLVTVKRKVSNFLPIALALHWQDSSSCSDSSNGLRFWCGKRFPWWNDSSFWPPEPRWLKHFHINKAFAAYPKVRYYWRIPQRWNRAEIISCSSSREHWRGKFVFCS